MYYNKAMFAAAGLKAPTTWEEMVTAAKALTDPAKKQHGFALAAGSYAENCHVAFMDAAHNGAKTDVTSHIAGINLSIEWNEIMAASLVVSVPVVIGFLLLHKHFVAGLTSGSLKEDPAHRGRVDSAEPRPRRRAPGVTRRVRGVGGQARVATGTSATVATRSSCSALSRTRLKAIGAWLFTSCPAFGTTVSRAPGRAAR